MPQSPEAQSFLNRIAALPDGPGVSLDHALQPSLEDEAQLRRLFATDKSNPRLSDPYAGLVDVFDAPASIRVTRARVVKNDEDLAAKYVMPLSQELRRKEGAPAMSANLEEFKRNWSFFTENSLSQLLDWNNVIASGGAVLACLSPLPDGAKASKKAIRKHFHSTAYPTSDVDLFLWGLTPEQAEVKINAIYEAICDSILWDVTCVRTKHTVSIHSQYPFRAIQIVLRLYQSPAEILAGFDVDAPCCAYDGNRVWANPRSIVAMMRQCNTVDVTRRSPSYEVRLAKYSSRGFEVHVPTLARSDVDPTIYERSIVRIEGLARLLALEKLKDTNARDAFLGARRTLRGRIQKVFQSWRQKRYPGDLKDDTAIGGLDMNDYDVTSLHIPYGPGWDARRIDKLVYRTDLGMNSTFNPKNKGKRLHRHPAFFGTMKECLEDCCEHCPEPLDDEERKLQEEDNKSYIKGRISFIQEDPGRQSISGSFNPIDVGEWSAQVYIGQMEKFFAAIVAQDSAAVADHIKNGIDVNRRDHVGRTPLHVAILSNAVEVACDLIDAGARMTARLFDGKTSLHLAAQMGQLVVIRKLFERSAVNTEQANSGEKLSTEDTATKNSLHDSDSQDDWSSHHTETDTLGVRSMDDEDGDDEEEDGDSNREHAQPTSGVSRAKAQINPTEAADADGVPEDAEDEPDILDVNAVDWDFSFTPLMYGIVIGSLAVVEELLSAGADPKIVTVGKDNHTLLLNPLVLTLVTEDDDRAAELAKRLLVAGASSSTADTQTMTIFHRAVGANNINITSTLLRCDPNANTVLNFPSLSYNTMTFPLITAINNGNYSMIALLLAHGVKFVITEEDISRAEAASNPSNRHYYHTGSPMQLAYMPAEIAITRCDDVIQLLLALNVDVNFATKESMYSPRFLLDWVRSCIQSTSKQIEKNQVPPAPTTVSTSGWKGYLNYQMQYFKYLDARPSSFSGKRKADQLREMTEKKDYLTDVERLLVAREARTGAVDPTKTASVSVLAPVSPVVEQTTQYSLLGSGYYRNSIVPQHMVASYDELFEACYTGNNEKIQQLCFTKTKVQPLQIAVRIVPYNEHYGVDGFTPLHAAILGRRWETAQLIMAIATAQYVPKEEAEKFTTRDIALELDDNESDNSEDSDEVDPPVGNTIDFTDVANRPSTVHCEAAPSQLLHTSTLKWLNDKKSWVNTGNIRRKAIIDNDLEAFVRISDLYERLSDQAKLDDGCLLDVIVNSDHVEILDEYIRRTGAGINIKDTGISDEPEIATNEKQTLYLGLSVHGKKRKDLARKNDPNAVVTHGDDGVVPLLWKAAVADSKSIVQYLCGDRPLAAYRFYASTHSDKLAERLRAVPDLEQVLPEWLGWRVSVTNESPLTSAILGNSLELLQTLFDKSPALMAPLLHERVKFLGYNPLMIALDQGAHVDLIDFLLAKDVSPTETDQLHGWNIFHILCHRGYYDLLAHLIRKLQQNVTEALLIQQCKDGLNTPMHVAVTNGRLSCVKVLLEFKKLGLLARNVDGCTPLHLAVHSGYANIIKLLVEASPTEALHAENGVGATVIEIAALQELKWRKQAKTANGGVQTFNFNINVQDSIHFDIAKKEVEITKLRKTLDQLLEDGRLKKGTKVTTELLAFAVSMEAKLATAKAKKAIEDAAAPPATDTDASNATDTTDLEGNHRFIREAVKARPGLRGLVHLIDVQRSVAESLKAAAEKKQPTGYYAIARHKEDEFKRDDDSEEVQKQASLVYKHVTRGFQIGWKRDRVRMV